jgi:hypothetical protein
LDKDVAFSYPIDPAEFGLDGSLFRLMELTPDGTNGLETLMQTIARTEKLSPRQLKVIVIIPIE